MLCVATSQLSFGQTDSLKTDTSKVTINTDITLSTRNVWRGASYGNAPSIQGTLSVVGKYFEVGTWGTTTLNGQMGGFGTWIENYATAKIGYFSLTLDDYFFFFPQDSLNNYLDYSPNKTNHLVEARIKYANPKFSIMAGYTVYSNSLNKTKGIYVEAEYFIRKDISIIASGVTDASWLNFYDKGGVTCIGLVGRRVIDAGKLSVPVKAQLLVNPNYKNISNYPNLGKSPAYFVVSVNF